MEKLLSIIIPTYNMEALLDQCLSSLLVKEHLNRLDVIVVNDGSKDNSSHIAHKYANKYPEVFRVIDKTNGNYGSCINAALPIVKGKYVKLLDADDSYNTNNLDDFLINLETIDVDLILSNFSNYSTDSRQISSTTFPFLKEEPFDFANIPIGKFLPMHSVTYNTEIFNCINYHQTEGISYTDMEWVFMPMTQVHSVYYYPHEIYKYLVGRDGQTIDPVSVQKHQRDAALGIFSEIDIVSKLDKSSYNYDYLDYWLKFRITNMYKENILVNNPYYDLKDFDNCLRVNNPDLYRWADTISVPLKYINKNFNFVSLWRNHERKSRIKASLLFFLHKVLNNR